MHCLAKTIGILFIVYAAIVTSVICVDLSDPSLSKADLIALNRDFRARGDPDTWLGGFFPVWAAIQFLIACTFLIVALIGTTCYLFGCRTPAEELAKPRK